MPASRAASFRGFSSKEEYSARLAVQCLRAEAIPEGPIKRVVAAILSTQQDAQFWLLVPLCRLLRGR
jgi:hypothetical protein